MTHLEPEPDEDENERVKATQTFMARIQPKIQSVAARLKATPSRSPNKSVIVWTAPEHEKIREYGEKIKAKEISYYAACIHLRDKVLIKPQRSFEGIRKKLKNYVNYGVFN